MFGKLDKLVTDDQTDTNIKKRNKCCLDNNRIIAIKCNLPTLIGSISINESRNLIAFGYNSDGFLGNKMIDEIICPPKQIPNLNEIKMVDCGLNHTVCIDYDGNMFTFGSNENRQLGNGKDVDELPFTHIPQNIIDIPLINFISCGNEFTICITNDRIAYSFGYNNYGQLGIGNHNNFVSPQLITDLNDIEFIQCGGDHVICKTYSNEYYSWGYNRFGQLGQGNYEDCNKPKKCLNWPDDIIDIKSGEHHTLILTSKGYSHAFGSNFLGQLGLNDKNINSVNIPTLIKDIPLIKRIECGFEHSMCIDINDNLWIFGNNEYGQLGLGDDKNRYKPTLNESLHDIIDIASRGYHTFIKTINNEIYAFGNNEDLQFGMATPENKQLTPIQVFKDNEAIWASNIFRSKQKSARK